jgi:hypothetical protein
VLIGNAIECQASLHIRISARFLHSLDPLQPFALQKAVIRGQRRTTEAGG